MTDQAHSLRQLVYSQQSGNSGMATSPRTAKIITVSSGKGGVGKSNFTLNFALTLQSMGKKVLVFDADIGMANIDVLMGVSSRYSLYHLIRREKSIEEVIQYGPDRLPYIAGGSGLADMMSLSEDEMDYFISQIERIASEMDYIIFDTGAGLSKENMKFITSADQCLVVTTPEPTSITDAYALIKVVHGTECQVPFSLIVNRAGDEQEAREAANKIILTAQRFLDIDIKLLGSIADDTHVVQAVKRQVPFTAAYPRCNASSDIRRIALRYMTVPAATEPEAPKGIKGFMHRWLKRTK
ncbi:Flagellum site-determining protein YlxH [Paenibacillus sp. GM2FR]|uniref:MinD/ParA family protein n=1 Tax=Paenibacillus sp. GM2FR TaxID=2059268 RepID=UPI000C26F5F3|nr:MinD/ParA family protein [Paenibacillus sp. GM2FR]PJN56052.1 Flagellum site-determining protein YlxH [Paenibacillus sp. GM2FR]